jgi:hypothetical protein
MLGLAESQTTETDKSRNESTVKPTFLFRHASQENALFLGRLLLTETSAMAAGWRREIECGDGMESGVNQRTVAATFLAMCLHDFRN